MVSPYEVALRDVKARVKASRTSFGAGMAALPEARRNAMYALYAFCREVDDIADDDGRSADERRASLDLWRERIRLLFEKDEASHSITEALRPAVKAYGLIAEDFLAIIDGMAMDAVVIAAPDTATLDLYCDRVASAVGRASVRIFGASGPNGQKVACHLGRALQLTNILRDLTEDAARQRLYLPIELLTKHGITTRDPASVLAHPSLPAVACDLAAVARAHFTNADAAMKLCPRTAMRPARVMRAYYGAILEQLVAEGWRDLSRRVRLSPLRKAGLICMAWF